MTDGIALENPDKSHLPGVLGKAINGFNAVEKRYIAALGTRTILRPLGIERLLYYRRHRRLVRSLRPYRAVGDSAAMLARIRGKKLVFAVTAGRTGTAFAQKLFALLPDVTSEHEPDPAFHAYVRQVETSPALARDFLLHYKLPFISTLATRGYVELSHVFCKGFLEPLLDLDVTPNLLVLRREPRAIALSMLERYTVPERTFLGLEWLISPRFAGGGQLPGWRRMTDYQLLFWYALEIERRQLAYRDRVTARGGVVREASAADLNDFDFFVELADALGLVGPAVDREALAHRHAAVAGVKWNPNDGPRWTYKGDIDREEEEVRQALAATR